MSIVYQENKKTGVVYVYESQGYWDKEKQQSRSHRKCIGKLDPETGELIPSKNYQLEKELEELKKCKPGKNSIVEYKSLFYGATYLLDAIGEQLGITNDLRQSFPYTYKSILSVAYYLILEDKNPLSRFTKWGKTHYHPFAKDITFQRSNALFSSISEHGKKLFFKAQSSRRLGNEYLAYNTTSISSYSNCIKQAKWGRNIEHDLLPQINLALVYEQESRLPVYFKKLPRKIIDVQTIQKMLCDLDFLKLNKIIMIMDWGFYSKENVNNFYKHHYKFLIPASINLKFVQQYLNSVRKSMLLRNSYSSKYELNYNSQTIPWDYTATKKRSGKVIKSKKRMYLHLYYNSHQEVIDRIEFNKLLDQLEEELITDNCIVTGESIYTKYFEIKKTPKRGIKITPKQGVIDEAQKNYGYYALISNKFKDPLEVLQIYRAKDIIEKSFENLKEKLNMRRQLVSSEENLDGKLFVLFVSLIYLAHIDKVMLDNNLYKNYTLNGLLDELDIIERIEQAGRKHYVGEVTKKQLEIYNIFGINPPL